MTTDDRWVEAQIAFAGKIRTAAYNSSYVSPEHDVEDMEQELLIVLWESCFMYDPDRGASFNTFFWLRVKNRVGMLQDRANAQMRSAVWVELDEDALSGIAYEESAELSCMGEMDEDDLSLGYRQDKTGRWYIIHREEAG